MQKLFFVNICVIFTMFIVIKSSDGFSISDYFGDSSGRENRKNDERKNSRQDEITEKSRNVGKQGRKLSSSVGSMIKKHTNGRNSSIQDSEEDESVEWFDEIVDGFNDFLAGVDDFVASLDFDYESDGDDDSDETNENTPVCTTPTIASPTMNKTTTKNPLITTTEKSANSVTAKKSDTSITTEKSNNSSATEKTENSVTTETAENSTTSTPAQ